MREREHGLHGLDGFARISIDSPFMFFISRFQQGSKNNVKYYW